MAKFKFRLTTLLKMREAARDERRAALAQAYEAESVLHQRERDLNDQMGQLREQYHQAALPGALKVDRLVENQRYELVLRDQQNLSRQQLQQLNEEIERRRAALVEADREVRVLEKLRHNQQRAHAQQEFRQEVKQLDEVAGRIRQETAQ